MPENTKRELIVERLFIEKTVKGDSKTSPLPFISFFDRRIIVLLGDPGSGKTTSFEEAVTQEQGAVRITPQDLNRDDIDSYKGRKSVYFDAVDECRVTPGGATLMGTLVGNLKKIGAEKLRIACRAADWHQDLDQQVLNGLLKDNEEVCVLTIEPLSRKDIKKIVTDHGIDAEAFLREGDRHAVSELFENPQILNMFIKVFKEDGSLPPNRAELFKHACFLMAQEINPYHRRFQETEFETERLLEAAGRIFAVQLCADAVGGFSLTSGVDTLYPWVGDIGGFDKDVLKACAKRTLFHAIEPEKVTYVHRTIAEYLAARYLSELVNKRTVSIDEILPLLLGDDGGVLSHVRGLYAWIATLSKESANALIRRDPLTVILYGDISLLTTDQKEAIIDGLKKISESDDPWFLSFEANTQFFGPLATKETAHTIKAELAKSSGSTHFKIALFEALAHGAPLPELADTVYSVIKDNNTPEYVRRHAGYAYLNIAREDREKLCAFLADLKSGIIADENREIIGHALDELYPKIIAPAELPDFLVEEPESWIGTYSMFLSHGIFEKTPHQQLQALIEGLATSSSFVKLIKNPRNFSVRRMFAKALEKAVSEIGPSIPIETLYRWLTLKDIEQWIFDREELAPIKIFFEVNPEIYRDIFKLCISKSTDDNYPLRNWWQVERLIGNQNEQEHFPEFLISLAATEKRENVRDNLLDYAIGLSLISDRADGVTLDSLTEHVKGIPDILAVFIQQRDRYLSERKKREAEEERHAETQATNRQVERENMRKIVADLMGRIEAIRRGTDIEALVFLNNIFLGKFNDLDKKEHPIRRLEKTVGDELSTAYVNGIEAIIRSPLEYPIDQIAKLDSSVYGNLVLAGIERIAEQSEEDFLVLPKATLQATVIFLFTNFEGFEQAWISPLTEKCPDIVQESLLLYFRIVLKEKPERAHGLSNLKAFEKTGGSVAIALLSEFPECEWRYLVDLFTVALSYGDHHALLSLVTKTLHERQIETEFILPWTAVGFLLDYEQYETDLASLIDSVDEGASKLIVFLYDIAGYIDRLKFRLSVSQISFLIKRVGAKQEPYEDEPFEERKPAHRLSGLIKRLSADTSDEAIEALRRLKDDPLLIAWRDYLSHATSEQKEEKRHKEQVPLTVKQVINVLEGRDPANHAHMLAIVTEALHSVAKDILDGDTNAYKVFWDNLKSDPVPKIENDCRDCVLNLLRPKLEGRNIAIDREGSYHQDTRSDIKVSFGSINLPIEFKRQHNPELWTGIGNQLVKKYANDPGANGYAVYCVFWFGGEYVKEKKLNSETRMRPSSPKELHEMLLTCIPAGHEAKINIVVFNLQLPVK